MTLLQMTSWLLPIVATILVINGFRRIKARQEGEKTKLEKYYEYSSGLWHLGVGVVVLIFFILLILREL